MTYTRLCLFRASILEGPAAGTKRCLVHKYAQERKILIAKRANVSGKLMKNLSRLWAGKGGLTSVIKLLPMIYSTAILSATTFNTKLPIGIRSLDLSLQSTFSGEPASTGKFIKSKLDRARGGQAMHGIRYSNK